MSKLVTRSYKLLGNLVKFKLKICYRSRQHNTRKNGGSKKTGELILKNSPQSEVTLANNCDPTISLGEFASGYIKQENNSNSDNIVSSLVGYEKKEIELNSVLPNNVDVSV